jgi:hypothetical protein
LPAAGHGSILAASSHPAPLMHTKPSTVLAALSASRARMLHGMELGFGRSGAIWSNS